MASPAERGCAVGVAGVSYERASSTGSRDPGSATIERMPVGRRLNPRERLRLVLEILGCYRDARRALSGMPIEEVVQRLRGEAHTDPGRGSERELFAEAWRLGRAVRLTLRLAPGDTRCLTRSLVLTQLLARRGIDAKIVIGVNVEPGFAAHAWVECAGQPVLPAGEDSFGRLAEL